MKNFHRTVLLLPRRLVALERGFLIFFNCFSSSVSSESLSEFPDFSSGFLPRFNDRNPFIAVPKCLDGVCVVFISPGSEHKVEDLLDGDVSIVAAGSIWQSPFVSDIWEVIRLLVS